MPTPQINDYPNESELAALNQALLRDNINKIEGSHHKDKLFHNLISAAQRKVKRKTVKTGGNVQDCKEEPTSPNSNKDFVDHLNQCCDPKDVSS